MDMLRVYVGNFLAVGALLERCSANFFAVTAPHVKMDTRTASSFRDLVSCIQNDTREMGLTHTAEIVEFHWAIAQSGEMTFGEPSTAVGEISRIPS